MEPNKATQYTTFKLGQNFDWVHNGEPGSIVTRQNSKYYDMPINQVNKPNKNGTYTTGGPWLAYKRQINHSGTSTETYRVGWNKAYEGRYAITSSFTNQPLSEAEIYSVFQDAEQDGAQAWAKLRPDQPDFSLALSVSELREIPRTLNLRLRKLNGRLAIERRKLNERGAGWSYAAEWWLALQFGWLPLYRDIKNFTEVFDKRHKRLDQLIRDERRPVKRARKISESSEIIAEKEWNHTTPYNLHMSPTHVTQCYPSGRRSSTVRTVKVSVSTWAEGQFRYILPPGPRTGKWKARMRHAILGGRLTPSTVYNIIPWTWLADYFTDLGDFIEAVEPGLAEHLWADYAYVMRTYVKTYEVVGKQATFSNKSGDFKRPEATKTITDTVKCRVAASPFGFGLRDEDLSLKQKSILGALGISRL